MEKTYKNFTAFATSELQDVLNEKLVFEASKPSWYTIDLADYRVPITKDGLYVVLLPVLKSNIVYGQSPAKPEERSYVPVIARQKLIRSSFKAFLYGTKTSGMGVYELQPAMIVKYSVEE
ncbi:hypothetical protein [Pedobacter metabolipauper]|uniref:Uncharacterized protein n=1 Tax=Pedobacter metabolipauper TaxID=425513 RepID=A0A4R6SVB2_9SPHI|nr:hypothetical protein [Pedobacter metabolipauper]TDQ09788.1 hypothetical protein ATK78_1947 [Pedobacter metabolipauper]